MIGMFVLGSVFALWGAGLSVWSGINEAEQRQMEIEARQREEKRMREARIKELRAKAERDIDEAKGQFKIETENAFRKADDIWHQGERIDMRSDLEETLTGRAFNLAIKKDNAQETGALMSEQRGKQKIQQQIGTMQAQAGMSGTRHGTNTQENRIEQAQTEFNQDLQLMKERRQTERDINLMSALSSLKGGMFGIGEKRDAANMAFRDSQMLRDDYSEGGRIVNMFNKRIDNRREDLEGNVNLMNIGGEIQQAVMQRAHDRAAYTPIDGFTDFFRGAHAGWNLGTNIASFASKWGGSSGTTGQGFSNTATASMGSRSIIGSNYRNPFGSPFASSASPTFSISNFQTMRY